MPLGWSFPRPTAPIPTPSCADQRSCVHAREIPQRPSSGPGTLPVLSRRPATLPTARPFRPVVHRSASLNPEYRARPWRSPAAATFSRILNNSAKPSLRTPKSLQPKFGRKSIAIRSVTRYRGHQAMVASTATLQPTWPSGLALVANESSCRPLPAATEDSPPLSERPLSRPTCGRSRIRECFTYGSVRGAARKGGPYRDPPAKPSRKCDGNSVGNNSAIPSFNDRSNRKRNYWAKRDTE
jgi:hypothetical protein